MTKVEEMYQELGNAALDVAPDLAGKLLIYAEVEDGVVSASLFYVVSGGAIRFRFASRPMVDQIYEIWNSFKNTSEKDVWRIMRYLIEDDDFKVEYDYPDSVDENEGTIKRRTRKIKEIFGSAVVDYSRPE